MARYAGAVLRRAVREQPWRHQWEEGEANESEACRGCQRRPHVGVAMGKSQKQPDHGANSHHEVERAIEDVPEDDEGVPIQEFLVDPFLKVETEGLLAVDDANGVVEGWFLDRRAHRWTELISNRWVDDVEDQRDQCFNPPAKSAMRSGIVGRSLVGIIQRWILVRHTTSLSAWGASEPTIRVGIVPAVR